jgi:Tol biopolymer transport system component
MKTFLFTTLLLTSSLSSTAQTVIDFSVPPASSQLFYEDFISTNLNERDFALSTDGTEIYFTITTPQSTFQTIVFSKKDKRGVWSKPEVVSFAGKYSDLEPVFSADGNRMYFASNRPLQGSEPKDFDIWVTERKGTGWSEPTNLGTTINTEGDEFYPSTTKSGNLYFTAQYENGVGKEDIFMARWSSGQFEKPIALDSAVNSKGYEFNAFIDSDEKFILFTSYGRKDDMGRGDLYFSTKDKNGKWLQAKNIKTINSNKLDYCPYVSPDKKILFFTSERAPLPTTFNKLATYEDIKKISEGVLNSSGNIYWVDFDIIIKSLQEK